MSDRNFDLAITGGTVYDGLGNKPVMVELGITAGLIEAIAPAGTALNAAQTIDASGAIVTPGFIDPHTHMDAQLFWDPSGAPSVLHGVTSIVIGSCGFGIAPLAPGADEFVLRSLESVEEIPYSATQRAVPMNWSTWPEYFEQIGTLDLGINVSGFVPHSALRNGLGFVGEGLDQSELDRMTRTLQEALEIGAVGMSTSRGTNHTDANGDPMSSRLASDHELRSLIAAGPGRLWQINIAAKGDRSDSGIAQAIAELTTYMDWSRETGARVTWTPLVVGPGDDVAWRRLLEFSEANADVVIPQIAPQPISSAISFDGPSFASLIDGWATAFAGYGDLPIEAKKARLADSEFRDALRSSKEDASRITAPNYDRWRLAASVSAPEWCGKSLREIADHAGRAPTDVLIDLALADNLLTVVEAPLSNLDEDAAAVRTLVTSPNTLIGLGDAGAHVKSITNYTYPSYVLGELARRRGWLTIADAIRRMTSVPAAVVGLTGRGAIREKMAADLCVIDLERLTVEPAKLVGDLPGGARRLHAGARGYRAVIVNGHTVVRDDAVTSARGGELLRANG